MAKKIIILERINEPSDNDFKYVLWATVPVGRESFYTNINAKSEYKAATAEELQDIKDGKVIERSGLISKTESVTFANIKNDLEKLFKDFQDEINNKKPFLRYGTFWDGTAWTSGGVA